MMTYSIVSGCLCNPGTKLSFLSRRVTRKNPEAIFKSLIMAHPQMSNPEERQKELDALYKVVNDSLDRDNARLKSNLILQFRNEVDLSKLCANQGDSEGAWLHSTVAQSIAQYLDTMK